jgi:hypothetical protein
VHVLNAKLDLSVNEQLDSFKNGFLGSIPEPNVIKLLIAVIYECMLDTGKPFQPSLMFVGEAKEPTPYGSSFQVRNLVRLQPFSQMLGLPLTHTSLLRTFGN